MGWCDVHGLRAPPATDDPYGAGASRLPGSMEEALAQALADPVLVEGLGAHVLAWYAQVKRSEATRFAQAEDKELFMRREYFSRY